MTEPLSTAEVAPEIKTASGNTLEKAWERAKPVLKTATGGALVTGAVALTSVVLRGWNADLDVPANSFMIRSLLVGGFLTPSALAGAKGASLMKEPVQDAFNYFKTKLSGGNK